MLRQLGPSTLRTLSGAARRRMSHATPAARHPGDGESTAQPSTSLLQLSDGGHIAYRYTPPADEHQPCVIFIHGLCSNMTGTKAAALEQHAAAKGYGCLCFDARGHGSSSGTFEGTHIGDWYQDAQTAVQQLAPNSNKRVLVGSSLGGWLALQLAIDHPAEVAGLLLIAPALDFTQRMWQGLTPQQQEVAQTEGRIRVASNYMEPVYASLQLIEQGKQFLMRDRLSSLQVKCPIRILHGVQDDAVPVDVSQQMLAEVPAQDMVLSLVKDGDHRLARPQDIRLMLSTLDGLVASCC